MGYLNLLAKRVIQHITYNEKGGFQEMALGVINEFEPIKNIDDLRERIDLIFKMCNIKNTRAKNLLEILFKSQIEEVIIPALAEILTILYDGDKESAYADISIAQFLNVCNDESR